MKGYIPLRMSVVITSVKPTSAFGCGCVGQCPTHDPTPWRSVVNGSSHSKHDHSTHVRRRPVPNARALARHHTRDRTGGLLCRPHKWVARRRAGSTDPHLRRRKSRRNQHRCQRGHAVRRFRATNDGTCNDRTHSVDKKTWATPASTRRAPQSVARPRECGLRRQRSIVAGDVDLQAVCTTMWCETACLGPGAAAHWPLPRLTVAGVTDVHANVHHGVVRGARSSRATFASKLCAPRCGARPHACGLGTYTG